MCKLLGVVEIENEVNAEKFVKAAIPFVTKTDNHGLGIMRLGENGVHIRRWLEPPSVVRTKKSSVLLRYEKALKHQENEAGKRSKRTYAIGVHGRYATCARSLANTHPFYRDGTALMHNGIISNASQFEQLVSTCDSEALLTQYLSNDVHKKQANLTAALADVRGYYAAIVFNNDGVIDIWRDETATLFMAHVRNVGVVFATTAEIIISAARRHKFYVTGIDEILPYTAIRWRNGRHPMISTFDKSVSYSAPLKYEAIAGTEKWGSTSEAAAWEDDKKWYMKDEGEQWSDVPRHILTEKTADEIEDEIKLSRIKGI